MYLNFMTINFNFFQDRRLDYECSLNFFIEANNQNVSDLGFSNKKMYFLLKRRKVVVNKDS